ncbi:MAG: nucleoside transporter [Candidatus Hydrogenedentes bacterium]|nr:nucleoside transporter [Candidatus Hydrogenedentota bacterium]
MSQSAAVMPEQESRVVEALDKLYEFEREPVSDDKLQPGRHFAGLFSGEHVAGTEFVIGAMFVKWGASPMDIFVGLLLGNLLAVLSWTFVCAPIAVRTRLTLYWYLRQIAGPATTTIYNILNAVLFCILAGCMITVSASAVRIPFGIPEQTGIIPTDIRFVFVVVAVGAVVVTLAILGFKRLSQFSEVCSPWMFLMFMAGAIAMLPTLAGTTSGGGIHSLHDFWVIASQKVWTGVNPEGIKAIGFWHVAAFAWICNLAMHAGLSDMAVLRYAPRWYYGFYSGFGMFLGHYLAWICAGIMGAAAAIIVQKSLLNLDAGAVAWQALGLSGIICVILAGWTTSNPTLYRAGLALQAVTPWWPRWLVTLFVGALTTLIACSPFVFNYLLNFVGIYGLLLMPVGAIVVVEHWIFPKIGFTQYWVTKKKLMVSWPALASWGIGMAVAFYLNWSGTLHLFFLFVPIWLLTAILYIAFSSVAGAREKLPELPQQKPRSGAPAPPKQTKPYSGLFWMTGIAAAASLAICILWPIWIFLAGADGYVERFASFKIHIIWPTLLYFIAGTVWYIRYEKESA